MRLLRPAVAAVLSALASFAAERPNIVVFLADDMGMGDIRAYDDSSTIPTPNMDRLAREGLRFTDAHTPASVCTPTRYGILSGRYPFRSRQYPGVLRSAYDPPLFDAGRETIADLLRRAGYRTAAFGKWHVGMAWTNRAGDGVARAGVGTSEFSTADVDFTRPILKGPLAFGFDYFYGIGSTINHGPYTFIHGDRVVELPTRFRPQQNLPGGVYREGWIAPSWRDDGQGPALANAALGFLKEHLRTTPERPFFVYYAATANHFPHVPPVELNGKPVRGQGGNDDGKPLRNDMIVENDVIVGELLAFLDDPNGDGERADSIAGRTLFLLTSDNGADFGYYAPIRDKKGSIYEGGHRVPLIARWPGRIPAGASTAQTVSLVDLYATFAALAGVERKAGSAEDSESFLPALFDPALPGRVRGPMLQMQTGGGKLFAVRDGDWKLILDDGRPTELYNLAEDLKETRNVLTANPRVVERLAGLYAKWMASR